MNKAQIAIIATELGIFAIAILVFWAFAGELDAMGYGILYIWALMPLASLVTSLVVGLFNIYQIGLDRKRSTCCCVQRRRLFDYMDQPKWSNTSSVRLTATRQRSTLSRYKVRLLPISSTMIKYLRQI